MAGHSQCTAWWRAGDSQHLPALPEILQLAFRQRHLLLHAEPQEVDDHAGVRLPLLFLPRGVIDGVLAFRGYEYLSRRALPS